MEILLNIGDFSRMTYLTVKALRHYHEVGLIIPAEVDPRSGYRRYAPEQVAIAQVVRRFRDLGVPLDEIRTILDAPDVAARHASISAHVRRLEDELARTRESVASLRRLLEPAPGPLPVEYRSVPATPALAISDEVATDEFERWWEDSFARLAAAVRAVGAERGGPDGALYFDEYFTAGLGRVTAFVPLVRPAPGSGPVRPTELPAAELAVTMHTGGFDTLDRAYGALGTYVAEREIGVDGPIRENYLPPDGDGPDPRVEVCWPIFQTAAHRAG